MINKIFNFEESQVRIYYDGQEIEWVAKDVATILGYKDTTNAIKRHCREYGVAKRHLIDTLGRVQEVITINEPNLFRLIAHSRLPKAEKFEAWIFEEVLPSIRKHGFWMNTKPTDEDMRNFIERFFPDSHYGVTSDKTGLKRLIPVKPYFRSCKIARANCDSQQDLFSKEQS